jgi:hypothetical protein
MTRKVCLGLVVFLALVAGARASEPCGIYARVAKVEVGPKAEAPEWVRIHGDFIIVKSSNRELGPMRGYLYFSIVKGKEDLCRLEWADLQKLAGTDNNFVAFGSAFSEINQQFANDNENEAGKGPGVRKADVPPANPVPYPLNHGLYRLRTKGSDSPAPPVAKLLKYLQDNPVR